jgi:hypothetical protein
MEDDVHHFRVRLQHELGMATAVDGDAPRTPWVICPGALSPLKALTGQTLDAIRRTGSTQRIEQCLHIFDLVLLAVDHAGDAPFERLYHIEADHDSSMPRMTLWRDDALRLSWMVDNGVIRGSVYDGTKLNELANRLSVVTADEREMAVVLRRASLISFVRRHDLDGARESGQTQSIANCYAKQPQRRALAARVMGSTRDFAAQGIWPLQAGRAAENARDV